MAGVKFSDLERAHQELSKQQKDIFYVSNRVELQKILQIIPKKNLGLDFCNDKGVREQLKKTFEELCQKMKWYTNKSNVILIQGTLQDLKTTIKNIKQLKVIITFSTDRRELKTKFANNFLKYIIDVLRYEKQKIEEIEVDDTQIKKSSGQGYADPPEILLNFDKSNWAPTIADIRQGHVGDCYLLAALLHLISKDPNAIKKCFVNRATIKSDKYVKIRFFKVNLVEEHILPNPPKIVAKPKGQVVIKIDKTVLMKIGMKIDQTTQKPVPVPVALIENQVANALWVNFIEKAFMIYKSNNFVGTKFTGNVGIQNALAKWNKPGPVKVENLSSGLGFIAYTAITGKMSSMNYLPEPTEKKFPINGVYGSEAEKIYKLFDTEIGNGKIIAVSTKDGDFKRKIPKGKSTTIWTYKNGSPKKYAGLIGKHAYAIVENVEKGEGPARDTAGKFDDKGVGTFKFIVLQNPHADKGFKEYKFDEHDKKLKRIEISNGGKLRIELNDFLKYFRCYDIMEN